MTKHVDKRTFIVRITTSLAFSELAAVLATAGDVEHIQLKDGSINPLTSNTRVPMAATVPEGMAVYRKRQYTEAGLAKRHATLDRQDEMRRSAAVSTLTEILRRNPYAPMFRLIDLMNASKARPHRRRSIQWTETTVKSYLDDALEAVTAPGAPNLGG